MIIAWPVPYVVNVLRLPCGTVIESLKLSLDGQYMEARINPAQPLASVPGGIWRDKPYANVVHVSGGVYV